ncbi:MAG: sugar phosphate isomerase/epimerase family protein [Vibrio sp.]|uniref:sugar phosphate isomerase/epimerase family protein n=1 Tax=Vibrio sp. TaxID=678 RepID=UPI003A85760E
MNNIEPLLLSERASNIPLYLHAYAYHLNMRFERLDPVDLLQIAYKNNLKGLKIHVEDGESKSLRKMDKESLNLFKSKASEYNLDIHIETSASDKETLNEAIYIAESTGATSVRFYPRYEGKLYDVLAKVSEDIDYLKQFDDCGLTFTIEQHEDLKSHELVTLVKNSGMKNLSILYDFANMVNANELPLSALETMAPYITQVHIKDAKLLKENLGWGHEACRTGYGDIPIKDLLMRLLLLGKKDRQVIAFGLEEEVDYYAPAFRFDDEKGNPWIPWREASLTPLPKESELEIRLELEKQHALEQIEYIKSLCKELSQ